MNNSHLAAKIKELRKRCGFSQEQLAEESRLSLRTVQRIESGESVPRGDTLTKLTAALKVSPDDVLEWAPSEDKGYLTVLNAGGFGFLVHPFLGIMIPLVMWILKKDKIRLVDDTGKKVISFQLTWTIVLFAITLIGTDGLVMIPNFSVKAMLNVFLTNPDLIEIALVLLYLYNFSMITINIWRSSKGQRSVYIPAVPFLR